MLRRLLIAAMAVSTSAFAIEYTFPPKKPAPAVSADSHYQQVTVLKFHEGSRVVLNGSAFSVTHQLSTRDTKFRSRYQLDSTGIDADVALVNALIAGYGATPRRFFIGQETSDLNAQRDNGEALTGDELGTLDLFFTLEAPSVDQSLGLQNALNAISVVEGTYALPRPQLPGVDLSPTTPDLTGFQNHLSGQMNFDFAQTRVGGNGTSCAIYDVETAALLDHEDLPVSLMPQIGVNDLNNAASRDHGVNVLGVLVAEPNAFGMRGVSPGAWAGLASPVMTFFWPYSPAHAISAATNALIRTTQPRETKYILIEQQFWADVLNLGEIFGTVSPPCPRNAAGALFSGSQCGMLPVEYYQAEFVAITNAAANAITVVEAAGNGSVNLDHVAFSRTLARESGAILAGASNAGTQTRAGFSNFGSRILLQGWGNMVATLGSGDLANLSGPTDERQWYSGSFGGTSSASPLVTGALCDLASYSLQTHGRTLSTAAQRAILQRTGTKAPGQLIGTEPNMRNAILHVENIAVLIRPDLVSTVRLGSDGAVDQLSAISGPNQWTHAIRGNFDGAGILDVFLYSSSTGAAKFFSIDFNGAMTPLGAPLVLSKGWSHVISGTFENADTVSDLFFYRLDAAPGGISQLMKTQNGVLTSISTPNSPPGSFTHVVPGNFHTSSGTELFFYRPDTGEYRFLNAALGQLSSGTLPLAINHVVPMNLNADATTDLLLYFRSGAVTLRGVFEAGLSSIVATFTLSPNLDAIVPTTVGVSDSIDDLLVYAHGCASQSAVSRLFVSTGAIAKSDVAFNTAITDTNYWSRIASVRGDGGGGRFISPPSVWWRNDSLGETQRWDMTCGTRIAFATADVQQPAISGFRLAGVNDFNRDGHDDLLWHNGTTGALQIWFMNGGSRLSTGIIPISVTDASGWRIAATDDLNDDGHTDLVWRHATSGITQFWYMQGLNRVSYKEANIVQLGSAGWNLAAVDDFNLDGVGDLLWYNPASGALQVWFMTLTFTGLDRTGFANLAESVPASSGWSIIGANDLNRDGKPDLVWRNGSSGASQVWFMNQTTRVSFANLSEVVPDSSGWKLMSR